MAIRKKWALFNMPRCFCQKVARMNTSYQILENTRGLGKEYNKLQIFIQLNL